MELKEKLEKLGDRAELMFKYLQEVEDSDSIPNISGWFIIDVILKTLCGWANTGGFVLIMVLSMFVALIMTFIMLFGVSFGWWTILILIFSIVPYLILIYLITMAHEYFSKSYEEYKLKKREDYSQYKQNKND